MRDGSWQKDVDGRTSVGRRATSVVWICDFLDPESRRSLGFRQEAMLPRHGWIEMLLQEQMWVVGRVRSRRENSGGLGRGIMESGVDVLDALSHLSVPVLAPPPPRLTDPGPVGRLIAGSREPAPVDEGLDQPGSIAIARLEICPETPHRKAQDP